MDLIGQRFGRLTVISKADRKGYVICKCDCGNTHTVFAGNLTRSRSPTQSCGCYRRDVSSELGKKVIIRNSAERIARNHQYGTNVGMITNQKLHVNNQSGHTGVWFDNARNTYQAYINLHNKRHNLGRFKSFDEAVAAREDAEDRLFAPIIDAMHTDLLSKEVT